MSQENIQDAEILETKTEATQGEAKQAEAPVEQPDVIVNLSLINALIGIAAEEISYAKMLPIVQAIEKNIKLAEEPQIEAVK